MQYSSVYSSKDVKNSISNFFTAYKSDINNQKILYQNKHLDGELYNAINLTFGDIFDNALRALILNEAWFLEKSCYGLGSDFLSIIAEFYKNYPSNINNFNKGEYSNFKQALLSCFEESIFRPSKKDIIEYAKSLSDKNLRLVKEILEKSCADDVIFLKDTNKTDSQVIKTSNIFFNTTFDTDFLLGRKSIAVSDYKFLIVDGFIDSIGEIHHLLHLSANSDQAYVLFCKGMRHEVKETIVHNLKRGTINFIPISFNINEETVNILNDIAACHDSDVISATKGDVISVAVKRELSTGNRIEIVRDGFYIKPVSDKTKNIQKNFLEEKLASLPDLDPNRKFIEKRIKSLCAKKLTIYLSKEINTLEKLEIDGFLKFLKSCRKGIVKKKNNTYSSLFKRNIYSAEDLYILFNKLKSVLTTLSSVECVVLKEKK